MDSVGGGAFIYLCGEMTLAAASEQGVISSRHPCSFAKKPERAALQGARTLRGGEEESRRMLIRAEPGAAASPHQRKRWILL